MRKHRAGLYRFIRGAERSRYIPHHARARNPKPSALAAFFPPLLSPQKEREPPEARQGERCQPWAGRRGRRPLQSVTRCIERRATARVAPTYCLTIELRRGGAPPRPPVGAKGFPVWTGSTSAERVAADRRRRQCESTGRVCTVLFAGLKGPDTFRTTPAQGIQNHWFWRRSFLPFFFPRKKGSRRRHAKGNGARLGRAVEDAGPYRA